MARIVSRDLPSHAIAAETRTRLAGALTRLGAAHLLIPLVTAAVAISGFVTGRSIDRWVLPVGVVLALLASRVWSSNWRAVRTTAALVLSTGAGAAAFANAVPDYSWDGLAYQQEAVIRLGSGWNPLAGSSAPYGQPGEELWIDHYPEVPWIAEAAVFVATGRVEAGKLFNLTMMLAAAALVTATLLRLTALDVPLAVLLGLLAALNPVAICQSSTFMVDAVMASALTAFVSALVLFAARGGWRTLVLALIAATLAINTKFTGLLYVIALSGLFVAFLAWRDGWRTGLRVGAVMTAMGVVAVTVLGYAPYVNNVREHGNPFYPMTPTGDAMDQQARIPLNLRNHNRVVRFLQANFSVSADSAGPAGTEMKPPFVITTAERHAIYTADLNAGGFGPLYSAMLVLGAVALITLSRRPARARAAGALLAAAAITISLFTHDQSWVARYAPQAWVLPLLVAVPCLAFPRGSFRWWLGSGAVALAVVNLAVVAAGVAWLQWLYIGATNRSLQEMTRARAPITVYFGGFRTLRERLHEAGIAFRATEVPPGSIGARYEIPAPGHRAFWFESQLP